MTFTNFQVRVPRVADVANRAIETISPTLDQRDQRVLKLILTILILTGGVIKTFLISNCSACGG